jgi:hypothetical protein
VLVGGTTAGLVDELASLGAMLGEANWWAPRPLRRLYARYGIRDEIQAERAGGSRLTAPSSAQAAEDAQRRWPRPARAVLVEYSSDRGPTGAAASPHEE